MCGGEGSRDTFGHAEASDGRLPAGGAAAIRGVAGRRSPLRVLLHEPAGVSRVGSARLRTLLRRVRAEPSRGPALRALQCTASGNSVSDTQPYIAPEEIHADRTARPAASRSGKRAVRAGGVNSRPDTGAGVMLDLALLPDGGLSWLD